MTDPSKESVIAAMDQAWRDHHHARDQTWKALQIEAVLGAGLVTVDAQFHNEIATIAAAVLVVLASLSGLLISWHHRKLERQKLIQVKFFQKFLNLYRDDLIPEDREELKDNGADPLVRDAAVGVPEMFSVWTIFNLRRTNTALFIMRMHGAIMIFAIVLAIARLVAPEVNNAST